MTPGGSSISTNPVIVQVVAAVVVGGNRVVRPNSGLPVRCSLDRVLSKHPEENIRSVRGPCVLFHAV
jgi:hypothetical protein